MITAKDISCQPSEVRAKSRTISRSMDSLGVGVSNMPASSNLSGNHKGTYTSNHNKSGADRKSETREIDKTDTPKKRNRRKGRKQKNKPADDTVDSPSFGSTPHSSPSFSKSRLIIPSSPASSSEAFNYVGISSTSKAHQDEAHAKKESFQPTVKTVPGSKQLIDHEFSCEIHSVKKTQHGKVFRKKNKRHKYINLRTFLGSDKKTCVFKSELAQLSAIFKNLSLGSGIKKKTRKYFETDDKDRYVPKQNKVSKTKRHTEMTVITTESDMAGNKVVQTLSVLEDTTLEIKEEASEKAQSESFKKSRRPKKERHRHNKLEKKLAKETRDVFPPHITAEMAKIGESTGELIRGFLRINPKSSRDSYVSNSNSTLSDYYLTSVADRNGALDGDEVLLKLKPETQWQNGQMTAFVVLILNKIHPRTTVGHLKLVHGSSDYAHFHPRDRRMPVMQIPSTFWPVSFKNDPKAFANILLIAKLLEWPEPHKALGMVTDVLGLSGDLRVETVAILKECCLDTTPFSPDMVQYLPKSKTISAEELERREDIRKECVFTIDPLTARDLDDAVSVKELSNGHYEIGVHISDASYYLPEGTPLDKMVSSKATTIYLVDSVFHMLPVELCLHCSLLPGKDKLAFSVFWEINEQGEIFNTRFARTVLNSCAQLAYEHAQQMIEDPKKEFKKEELPEIFNGFTSADLSKTVNVLQKIAVNLREARVQNGSLRIDQVKLLFSLNPSNGEPSDFIVYENKESHRLIEEFMLLANISVAKKIHESFPDIAFLRCHEAPKFTMLVDAQKCLETCGIHIDISSSGGIHSSLRKYITDDYQGLCRGIVLNHIFAKPMTRARYFCASTMDSEEGFAHYALSIPIYTHFTSPIRRYADIMVHRLLSASLGYAEKPDWNIDQVISIAANCNKQKHNAKRAGEASSDLYLAHYIENNQPYIQDCVVVDVKDRSFDAVVIKTGSMVRVYQKICQDNPTWRVEAIPISIENQTEKQEHQKKVLRLIITFPVTKSSPEPFKLPVEMFTVVKIKLTRVPNTYKLEPLLLRPVVSRVFERTDSSNSSVNA